MAGLGWFMPRDIAYEYSSNKAGGIALSGVAPATSALKRGLDVSVAAMALMFLLPLLAFVALAIWLESGGPVIFRQSRSGLNGAPFTILKFRTMYAVSASPVTHASRRDRRITHVGRFLRRSSLDELPQLFNVLRGEMSLVGPRPHATEHDEYYAPRVPAYSERFATRPGLTGLAQVSGQRGEVADAEHMAQRIKCDLEYIRSWSIGSDLSILLRTLVVAPFDPAAY